MRSAQLLLRALLVAVAAIGLAGAAVLPARAGAATATGLAATPVPAPRVNLDDLEDEVMCVVCGRPLATSSGSAADQERELIQGWIDEGLTKAQVKQRLVAEYGDRALVNDRSPIAASAPWIALLVGAASITVLLRRRRQRDDDAVPEGATDDDPSPSPGTPTVSAADDARIDAELAELDERG